MYVADTQLGATPTLFRKLAARAAAIRQASPAVVAPVPVRVPKWMNLPAQIVRRNVTALPRVAVPAREPLTRPLRGLFNLPLPGAPRTPTAPAVLMPAPGAAAALGPAPAVTAPTPALTELEPAGGAGEAAAAEPPPAPAPVEPAAAQAAQRAGIAGGTPVGILLLVGLGLAVAASASGRGRS